MSDVSERAINAMADAVLEDVLETPKAGEMTKAGKTNTGQPKNWKAANEIADPVVREKAVDLLTSARWGFLDLLERHGFVVRGSADSLAFVEEFADLIGKRFEKKEIK